MFRQKMKSLGYYTRSSRWIELPPVNGLYKPQVKIYIMKISQNARATNSEKIQIRGWVGGSEVSCAVEKVSREILYCFGTNKKRLAGPERVEWQDENTRGCSDVWIILLNFLFDCQGGQDFWIRKQGTYVVLCLCRGSNSKGSPLLRSMFFNVLCKGLPH